MTATELTKETLETDLLNSQDILIHDYLHLPAKGGVVCPDVGVVGMVVVKVGLTVMRTEAIKLFTSQLARVSLEA